MQGVKQSYDVCCLTGHVFKGVQSEDVNNKKMMPRSISSPISLAYLNFSQGSELVPSTAVCKRTSFLRIVTLLTGFCTAKPVSKGKLSEDKTSQMFALASFHGLNNISDQYLHRPAKTCSRSQKQIVHMKQTTSIVLPFHFKPYYIMHTSSSNQKQFWLCLPSLLC